MKLRSDLENRVVVITGGAGLIGQGLVEAVVENGGTAIIADIDEVSGNKVKDDLLDAIRYAYMMRRYAIRVGDVGEDSDNVIKFETWG